MSGEFTGLDRGKRPARRQRDSGAFWVSLAFIGSVVFLGTLCGGGVYVLREVNREKTAGPVEPADLGPLLNNWKKNPVLVADAHDGKRLLVTGTVQEMNRNLASQPYLIVGADGTKETAQMYLGEEQFAAMKDYPVGSRVGLVIRIGPAESRMRAHVSEVRPPAKR